jgi:endo-1,4-beta-mannosidase
MQAIVCLDDSLNGADQYMRGNDAFHTGPDGHLVTRYWEQKAYRQAYIPNLRKIVGAFKTHPAVFIWELGNEYGLYPQPPQQGDATAFYEFAKEASGEIRQIASPNQLVALGLISTHHVFSQSAADDRYTSAKRLYQLPSVDAVGVHYYRDNYDDLKPFIKIDCDVAGELGKPFYVGELGAKEDSGNRPAYYASEIDGWKQADAMSVLLWQLDSSPMDVGVSDDRGFARWKSVGDYQAILDQLKTRT